MKNKSSYSPVEVLPAISLARSQRPAVRPVVHACGSARAAAGRRARMDACRGPPLPLPPHDEKTDAVLLYSEQIVNVQSAEQDQDARAAWFSRYSTGGRDTEWPPSPLNAHRKSITGFAAGVFQPKGRL